MKLFNYTFKEKERDLGNANFNSTNKEVIAQLLKRIKCRIKNRKVNSRKLKT